MDDKFNTPCFIRKNTPEIREKLEEIGYVKVFKNVSDRHCLLAYYDNYYSFDEDESDFTGNNHIDCGDNEELFFALSALRYDSDKYQWFTDGHGDWILCRYESLMHQSLDYHCWLNSTHHKATKEELISHFTDK